MREITEMKIPKTTSLPHARGFTLIEIVVVVVIIGLLAAMVAPRVMKRTDDAKLVRVANDIRAIEASLNLYKLDNFNYPSTEQGLQALVTKPTGSPEANNWKQGGYLRSVPKDPWGKEYQYANPGSSGAGFDLFSFGADGKTGGEDMNKDLSLAELN